MRTPRRIVWSTQKWMGLVVLFIILWFVPISFRPQDVSSSTPSIEIKPTSTLQTPRTWSDTTIVSCFFDLNKMGQKTKHPPDFYLSTGKRGTLAIHSPMIIFTDSPVGCFHTSFNRLIASRMK